MATDEPADAAGSRSGEADMSPSTRSKIIGDLGGETERPSALKPIEMTLPPAGEEPVRPTRFPVTPESTDEIFTGPPGGTREPEPAEGEHVLAVIIELNVSHPGGLSGVRQAFFNLFEEVVENPVPMARLDWDEDTETPRALRRISPRLYKCLLTRENLNDLIRADEKRKMKRGGHATIFKAWLDYALDAQIDRSAPTVKADAARRSYAATGKGIVWAVMDSGIDAKHPHFSSLPLAESKERQASLVPGNQMRGDSPTFGRHRDFTKLVEVRPPDGEPAEPPHEPLTDGHGHGTHVAGIIAGACPPTQTPHVYTPGEPAGGRGRYVPRKTDKEALCGMAPDCSLVSLKVLRVGRGGVLRTNTEAMIRAIDYIQNEVNVGRGPLQIHGVNISIGCEWDARAYAAGQSPLCQAVNQLADSGVIVVISAGNLGYAAAGRDFTSALGTITEPGHADGCITVGSTHRDSPHVFGVTFDSSKGPTMDGRRKPDVVAPGEWITSAATGAMRREAGLENLPARARYRNLTYAEASGTSMAAPHVSGVIAAFLSARPEFIGRPRAVKQLLMESATDLRREPYAQGAGLVDLMRMLADS